MRLPRQPGQKEGRFAHLLSGEIDVEALAAAETERVSGASTLQCTRRKGRCARCGSREAEGTIRTVPEAVRVSLEFFSVISASLRPLC